MSVHRFVHIGDLHLGPNSRNADRIAALDQIIAENILQPVAAWLWPGDLNHGRMTIDDRNVLVARVQRMADKAPVVICYGNHDLHGDLDFLSKLHAVWPIFVVAHPEVITVPLTTGGTAAIYVLPYPTRAGLVAAGVPSDHVVDAARGALDLMFMAAAAELQQKTAEGCVPLMIGHVNVAGSILSAGQPNIGKEIEVDQPLLQRFGDIYIGLNHIHKGQKIGGAHYPGSCCRLDWGEVEPKRYLVIAHEQACDQCGSRVYRRENGGCGDSSCDGTFRWTFSVESRPLDVAPMYHVEGELTREGFAWRVTKGQDGPADEKPVRSCPNCGGSGLLRGFDCTDCDGDGVIESFDGCEVRVRYRYNAEEKAALDFSLVEQPFVGAKRLDQDPIALRSRAIRSPQVAAALTLEAKAEAYVTESNLPWTPGMIAKISALQNPDGAAFLTEVHSKLSGVVGVSSSGSTSVATSDTPLLQEAL